MGWTPFLLVVTPDVPANNLAELIGYARCHGRHDPRRSADSHELR
jgi:hypothetical protein